MSSTALPIPPQRFAEAIKVLPLANLHLKATEIRNSMVHLVSSNQQLQLFADEGDSDCAEAIWENLLVMRRMEERVSLLKHEVEGRGFKWGEDEPGPENVESNGYPSVEDVGGASRTTHSEPSTRPSGGRLGDEELARRLREQMEEDGDDDEAQDGVHFGDFYAKFPNDVEDRQLVLGYNPANSVCKSPQK
ncbi:MAG: hypothetical protein ASARMPREDX12_005637 [Alectoria sarmentosa]|nr:MAG: hypothetical protein ASARMPREDX12_005637 [Alectoria sarmentosa]